ncbi:MAG: hypothetical protein QME77_11310 [bacterium]|nr:hypothetical protein [bacterium]
MARSVKERGFTTPQVIACLEALEGVRLSQPRLAYWIHVGLAYPSVRKARGTGTRHLWSPEDIVALRWLLRLRKQGVPLQRYRRALATLWRQLPELLAQDGELFFVAVGKEVAVRRPEELATLLTPQPGQMILDLWPAKRSAREVRRELAAAR